MKHIIVQSDYLTEGLFGQVIIWLVEILPMFIDQKIYPHFLVRSKNYGSPSNDYNIFPSILQYNYVPQMNILPYEWYNFLIKQDSEFYYISLEKLKRANKLFVPDFNIVNKNFYLFFKINEDIINQLNYILPADMENSLGIHYRGTDKIKDTSQNINQISDDKFYNYIDYVIKTKNLKKIYLATDSLPIYTEFNKKFNLIPIISLNIKRCSTDIRFFEVYENQKENASNAMIDSLALSKCTTVISTNSALSAWSKIFNPKLDIVRLNDFPQNWFPIHYIPKINI